MQGLDPASGQKQNAEVGAILGLEIGVNGIEVLRSDQQQGVEVLAVGGKPAYSLHIKKLTDIQPVGQRLDGGYVFQPVLVLLIDVGISKVRAVDTQVECPLIIGIVFRLVGGVIQKC